MVESNELERYIAKPLLKIVDSKMVGSIVSDLEVEALANVVAKLKIEMTHILISELVHGDANTQCINVPDGFPAVTFSLTSFEDVPRLVENNELDTNIEPISWVHAPAPTFILDTIEDKTAEEY
ncbi:hypothetical protein E2562_020473 [Oryza meyeriana var. granulata]|uniref:Uncharacterized protein n=1 Tax=Oryza meyeriana var. granulata TaxID=110450 RepID=A0A6G1D6D1_9ORYZ|nr:hypothetical protein E2562_020473 [Oryza meyeriana var. granulata]